MTPQEKELILSVANKLKASPNKAKDNDAEQLINTEIGSQQDVIYKLTQAVLVQEMALKDMKQKNEYLTKSADYYKDESNRGAMSKMFGGNRPAPLPPQPTRQPSAFGSFMQTAAGVAAGMVAGNLISNMLFDHDSAPETADAASSADVNTAESSDTANDATADNSVDSTQSDSSSSADIDTAAIDNSDASFLSDNSGLDSGFGSDTGFGSDSGFGSDLGFSEDSNFGTDTFANNDYSNDGLFGGDDSGFGGGDFGEDDF